MVEELDSWCGLESCLPSELGPWHVPAGHGSRSIVNPRGNQVPPRAAPNTIQHNDHVIMGKKKAGSVLVVSQLNCKQQQQQNLSSSRAKVVTRHGHVRSHAHAAHQVSSFHIFRLSNQDPTDLCLSSRPTPRKRKKGSGFFYSILVLIFFCFLCPFDSKHERKRGCGRGKGDESLTVNKHYVVN